MSTSDDNQAPYGQFRPEDNSPGESRPWPVYQGQGGEVPRTGGYAQYQQPGPFPPAGAQKLPSRAGAIWMLVVGLVSMFIIAPITFFAVVLGPLVVSGDGMGMQSVSDGATVVVDDSGTIVLTASSGSAPDSCVLAENGNEITINLDPTYGLVIGNDIAPGSYQLTCDPSGGSHIVIPGHAFDRLISGIGTGFLWATFVGLVGLGLTIGGIVWLVNRNRARREITRNNLGGYPY